MRLIAPSLIALAIVTLMACADEVTDQSAWSGGRTFTALSASVAPGPAELCHAVHVASGGAGLYEIVELRANPSRDPDHVYVEAWRIESWSTLSRQRVILRLPGEVEAQTASVGFRDGEQVGLLFLPQSLENEGFFSTLPELVLRYDRAQGLLSGPLLDAPQRVPEFAASFGAIEAKLTRPYEAPRPLLTSLSAHPQPPPGECPADVTAR